MNIINGFIRLIRGLLGVKLWVRLFILWLIIMNVVAAIYFMPRVEATVTLISFMLGGVLMGLLTTRWGFTRILGLAHVAWLPGMFFVLSRLPRVDFGTSFGVWIGLLLITNCVALVFDGLDVWRYFRGETEPMDGLTG